MIDIEQLPITGYQRKPLPHLFLKQKQATDHAALVFPGLGYTAQMPVLFYAAEVLQAAGADVLRIDTNYIRAPGFRGLSPAERAVGLRSDVEAAVTGLLKQRGFARLTLIGKSLGTRAMGHVLTGMALPDAVEAIWLTPLLTDAGPPLRPRLSCRSGASDRRAVRRDPGGGPQPGFWRGCPGSAARHGTDRPGGHGLHRGLIRIVTTGVNQMGRVSRRQRAGKIAFAA